MPALAIASVKTGMIAKAKWIRQINNNFNY